MAFLDETGVVQLTSDIKTLADATYLSKAAVAGGSQNQVLTKNSSTDGDVSWKNVPTELPSVSSSDNGKILKVTSGAWAKGDAPTELPSVTTSDNGKILKVTSGAWAKGDAPTELPAVTTSDNGKVLTVSSGAWSAANVPTELPAVTTSDNGKVLQVSGGAWGKATLQTLPSGGTSGQYLKKNSSTDGDASWATIQTLPSGGTQGQLLTKNSSTDGDASWVNAPTELPSVTSSDNGKVLTVSNGAWGKANVPTELPSVTSSDNGKVLTVSNGTWGKADAPTEIYTVTVTSSGNTYSSDKSFDEIMAAAQAGKTVILIYSTSFFRLTSYTSSVIYFRSNTSIMTNQVTQQHFQIYKSGNSTVVYSSTNIVDMSLPTPCDPNCLFEVRDDGAGGYFINYFSLYSIDEIMNYLTDVTLIYTKSEWGNDGTAVDGDVEYYSLIHEYTTNVYDSGAGDYVFTGHLVFANVTKTNSATKLKMFTVSNLFSDEVFENATVTYSEEEIGGSGLPAVTSSDNGKFLQVVNGAWAAVELQAASGVSF